MFKRMTFIKRIEYFFDVYIGPSLYRDSKQKSYYEYLKQKWGDDYDYR